MIEKGKEGFLLTILTQEGTRLPERKERGGGENQFDVELGQKNLKGQKNKLRKRKKSMYDLREAKKRI